MQDIDYMRLAIDLAERGCGWVSPNPLVGAVIVKEGRIIGRGWHQRYGEPHAERNALADCSESPAGATMYVTLEPCCHQGKQPPCTEAILAAGIRRVVVAAGDPNPLVRGKGIRILRQAGLEVETGLLEEECLRQNEVFFHYISTKRPFVVMKYAMTMDGKIAAYTGDSKWITGEEARNHVQGLRNRYSGIMVGLGTVLADDPMLNCRIPGGKDLVRILCDSQLRCPLDKQLIQTAYCIPTILATCCRDKEKQRPYLEKGCQVLEVGEKEGRVDLNQLMEVLGQMQIDSILLEGGGTLNWAALKSGIVQKCLSYIAPKLFGGATAKTPVEGQGVPSPGEAFFLKNSRCILLGQDILIESDLENKLKSEVATDVHRDH